MTLFEALLFYHGGEHIPNIWGVQICRHVDWLSKPDYIPGLYFKVGTYYSVRYFGASYVFDESINTNSDTVLWDVYRKKKI